MPCSFANELTAMDFVLLYQVPVVSHPAKCANSCAQSSVYTLAKLLGLPCRSGQQRSLACQVFRQLLCFQLLQDDEESLKVGVAECFEQANFQRLFGTLHITACMLHGHRRGIDRLSAEVVPAAVFLLFVFMFFL